MAEPKIIGEKKENRSITDPDFTKDVAEEQTFLSWVDKTNLETQETLLKKVYNQELESFVRNRVDFDMLSVLMILEPMDKTNVEGRHKAELMIKWKRVTIDVLRKQMKLLKELHQT